jgi:type II secretion system protein I
VKLSRSPRFTLVEVLLAVAILSLGIVGVLAAYAKSADTLRIAQDHIEAFALLKQKMSEIETDVRRGRYLASGRSEGEFEGAMASYTWELEVSQGPAEYLDAVVLTVKHKNRERTYALATYLENEMVAVE